MNLIIRPKKHNYMFFSLLMTHLPMRVLYLHTYWAFASGSKIIRRGNGVICEWLEGRSACSSESDANRNLAVVYPLVQRDWRGLTCPGKTATVALICFWLGMTTTEIFFWQLNYDANMSLWLWRSKQIKVQARKTGSSAHLQHLKTEKESTVISLKLLLMHK